MVAAKKPASKKVAVKTKKPEQVYDMSIEVREWIEKAKDTIDQLQSRVRYQEMKNAELSDRIASLLRDNKAMQQRVMGMSRE